MAVKTVPVTVLLSDSDPTLIQNDDHAIVGRVVVLQNLDEVVAVQSSLAVVDDLETELVLINRHAPLAVLGDFLNVHVVFQNDRPSVGSCLFVHHQAFGGEKKIDFKCKRQIPPYLA